METYYFVVRIDADSQEDAAEELEKLGLDYAAQESPEDSEDENSYADFGNPQ